jgi:hypothetical protein
MGYGLVRAIVRRQRERQMMLAFSLGAVAFRRAVPLLVAGAFAAGCAAQLKDTLSSDGSPLAVAERFIDAFYSFDAAPLRSVMASAPTSLPKILYYQGWAEGGNYVVLQRKPCRLEKPNEVRCDITVKDDLIAALGTGFDVTDSFHLTLEEGRIVSVRTSSNDPPEMEQAFKWLRRERPDIWTGPCRGFYAGGLTPQDCVRAVVRGFADFTARPRS